MRFYLWMEISQWICDETEVIKSNVMRMIGLTEWNQVLFFLLSLFIGFHWTELSYWWQDWTRHSTHCKWFQKKCKEKENRSRTIWKYCHESWCTSHMHNYHDVDHIKSSNNNQISAYLDIRKMPFVLPIFMDVNIFVYGCSNYSFHKWNKLKKKWW